MGQNASPHCCSTLYQETLTPTQIYPNWVPHPSLTPDAAAAVSIDYLDGEDRVMGETMLKDWMTRRARYMYGHPHIREFSSPSFPLPN